MTEKAKFEVELVDSYSRNALKAAAASKALLGNQKKLDRLKTSVRASANARALAATQERYNLGLKNGAISAAKFAGKMALVGGAVGVAFAGITAHLAAKRIEETEATIFALDRLTHHGEKTFGEIRGLSKDLGLDIDETGHAMANFLKLQFPEAEAKKYIKLGADMQALGNSADDVQGIFRALGQIRSKGRIQAEEMLQLAERGVSQELVYEELQKGMGLGTGPEARKRIMELQQQGKVSAQEFFVAFEAAINRKLGQAEAGESAKKFVENTFRGSKGRMMATAQDFWIDVAELAKPGIMKGFNNFSDTMERFMADEATMERMGRVMSAIGDGVAIAGEALGLMIPKVVEATEAFGLGFADTYNTLGGDIRSSADALKVFGEAMDGMVEGARILGEVLGGIAGSIEAISNASDSVVSFVLGVPTKKEEEFRSKKEQQDAARIREERAQDRALASGAAWSGLGSANIATTADPFAGGVLDLIKEREAQRATELGASWGDGFATGIAGKSGEAYGAGSALAASAEQGARQEAQIHSPSRKAKQLGNYWSDGWQEGMDENQPQMALPGGANPTGINPMGGTGGSVQVGNVTIEVMGSDSPEQTAQAVLRAFERNLGAVLNRTAIGMGAA